MTTHIRPVDLDLAAARFAEHYGERDVRATALPGERDLNLLIDIDGAPAAVFKLMHPDAAPDDVALPCAVLEHVGAGSRPVALPAVLKRVDGEHIGTVDWADGQRLAYAIRYCGGTRQSELPPLATETLRELGGAIANLVHALADFEHPALDRPLGWNLTEAASHATHCHHIEAPLDRTAARVLARFAREAAPALAALPAQAIHNDLNDHNVLLTVNGLRPSLAALIDVGDTARQPVICELAIACAYSSMRQSDPVAACAALARGFHAERPLSIDEVDLLPLLIKSRLAVSLAVSSRRFASGEDDPYLRVSQRDAAELLTALEAVPEGVFRLRLRAALGLPGLPHRARVLRYLESADPRAVIDLDNPKVLDLGVGSLLLGADPANGALAPLTERVEQAMASASTTFSLGRYLEPRMLYAAAGFGGEDPTLDRRTVHLGIDVFCQAGTPVRAPLAGRVHRVGRLDRPLDYGPVLMLRHDLPDGESFFTLYGHLAEAPVLNWREGDRVDAGTEIARVGAPPGNGGWPPHLHLQLILDDLGLGLEFAGVCDPRDTRAYAELCPNPAPLLGLGDPADVDARHSRDELAKRRARVLGPSLSLSYREPLHVVRGFGAYLYDDQARGYLDFYNNVAHVGHSHPHVVEAVQRQIALLNTNTRYLHQSVVDYAERLCGHLPEPLSVCYFVNSASEANELALRLARHATGRQDIVVAADAYHGHTSALIDMSPYKYNGRGGKGPASWVHEVPVADDYRGPYRRGDGDVGARYAATVADTLASLGPSHACAAFFAETMPSVGGQIIPPKGYLAGVYEAVRAHGGLCIADEVQTGFGRLGEAFWGFETQDVVPDIVVLGKPIANGFPMGAVVTTPDIAQAFDNGMEFFATFGGNPVACAAAQAMLDVVERDDLASSARVLGAELLAGLRAMADRYPLIGDVRGMGFFLGIELVLDRATLEPAAAAASEVVERLLSRRVLCGVDGPLHNVVKLRPTLVTSRAEVTRGLAAIDASIAEVCALHIAH